MSSAELRRLGPTDVGGYACGGTCAISWRLFGCQGILLLTDDAGQRAERSVDDLGAGEHFGYVRFEHDHIRALRITARILSPHPAREIIFCPHFGFGFFLRPFLHSFLVRAGWLAGR